MSIIFFFKQKTAYEMRISDWSSDVCCSDLKVPIKSRMIVILISVNIIRILLHIQRIPAQCPAQAHWELRPDHVVHHLIVKLQNLIRYWIDPPIKCTAEM